VVEVTELEYLVLCDSENVVKSMANLSARISGVPEGIQAFMDAIGDVGEQWGEVTGYKTHQSEVDRWVKEMGLAREDITRILPSATLLDSGRPGDTSASAQRSFRTAVAVVARAILTDRLRRDFLWGVTDLLRLRETPAVGYIRLQCETAALIGLMHREPAIAPEWMSAVNRDAGRKFFKKWNEQIRSEVSDLGFDDYYGESSNTALHSRVGGVARGYLIGGKTRKPGVVRLCYQELDNANLLVFALLRFLGFHGKILRLVERLYPELDGDRLRLIDRATFFSFLDSLSKKAIELRGTMSKDDILLALGGNDAIRK